MDKNYLQGVVPPAQKRSIRDIPIPARGSRGEEIKRQPQEKHPDESENKTQEATTRDDYFENFEDEPVKKKGKSKKIIIISSVIFLLLIAFLVISSFDKAVIKVTPKIETTSFEEKILIEDLTSRVSSDSLGFRTMVLSQQSTKTVKAVSEEPVQEKASGKITIYNEYSEQSQRLIKNTRFESSDGKIYRIEDSIDVPGYTEKADGSKTPGEITVTVYADEVGEDYNLSSDTFTIPGFKGQEPYDFFSAKTETAINGGFDGIRKIVSEEDIEKASEELEGDLREKLLVELNNETTDEFYTNYTDDSFVFEDITQEQVDNSDDVQLMMRGKISAKVFNKVDISNSLAKKLFSKYSTKENTLVEDFNSLNLSIESEESEEKTEDYLKISGNNSKFVWQIDNGQLKKDLVGVEVSSLANIMKNYTEIKNAEASIKPFWKSKYPDTEKDIIIEITE